MSDSTDEGAARVERALRRELARIDAPEQADEVLERAERIAADDTEQSRGDAAAARESPAPAAIEQAADGGDPTGGAAATLDETAAQAVAPTPEAHTIVEAAQRVMRPSEPLPPSAQRGRRLLREAALRRMAPIDALDARLFLLVNGSFHPPWLDALAHRVTVYTHGGWIWSAGLVAAASFGLPGGRGGSRPRGALHRRATTVVEHGVKFVFRRRRPFIDVIRATVVGKEPGSWSFPSGHTASSFAAAWALSTCWPRRAPLFFALASCVGLSRIYVGAHYPGDVTSGALFGVALSELIRRLIRLAFRP